MQTVAQHSADTITNIIDPKSMDSTLNIMNKTKTGSKDIMWESASVDFVKKELAKIAKDFNIEKVDANFDMAELMRKKIIEQELEDPFYIIDVGVLKQKIYQWKELLPRVEPFYAIKCNPHPVLLRTLRAHGVGFDCASKSEIATVLTSGLKVSPNKIIFANPCKPPTHLAYAKSKGVTMMTFDNRQELVKIAKHYPTARLILRILTDDSSSICRFGSKFGAPPSHIPSLLQSIKDLKLDLCGVSFHVGSGCLSTEAFVDAVKRAHGVFRKAEEMGLPPLQILDIGGGFPGATDPFPHPSFCEIAKALRGVLDELFPENMGVKIIAEPGRYFAAETHSLAVCVFARRDVDMEEAEGEGEEEEEEVKEEIINAKDVENNGNHQEGADDESVEKPDFLYYVNDGVYGSFNCLIFDHAKVTPLPLKISSLEDNDNNDKEGKNNNKDEEKEEKEEKQFRCKIFGPTCDSLDCITKDAMLPKLEIGDWMYFKEMGAYTVAAGSEFNGFLRPEMYFVDSEPLT